MRTIYENLIIVQKDIAVHNYNEKPSLPHSRADNNVFYPLSECYNFVSAYFYNPTR